VGVRRRLEASCLVRKDSLLFCCICVMTREGAIVLISFGSFACLLYVVLGQSGAHYWDIFSIESHRARTSYQSQTDASNRCQRSHEHTISDFKAPAIHAGYPSQVHSHVGQVDANAPNLPYENAGSPPHALKRTLNIGF
jgi:hypothetical protein